MLALQHTAGNRAVSRLVSGEVTVQGYWTMDAGYGQEGTAPEGRADFPYQRDRPEWGDRPQDLRPVWTGGRADSPALKVSDDATLAIGTGAGREQKAFYADPDVVTAANEALTAATSPVRLAPEAANRVTIPAQAPRAVTDLSGTAVTRPETAERVLTKVVPQNSAGGALALVTSVCRDVAAAVQGGMHQSIVLGRPGQQRRAIKTGAGDTEFSGARDVYSAMAGRTRLEDVGKEAPSPTAKTEYAAMGAGARRDAAAALGVNQFARADIGQSYVIHSAGLPGEQGFGYHVAAVVANSLDRNDHITLENYNRGPARKALITELRGILAGLDPGNAVLAAEEAARFPGQEDVVFVGYMLFRAEEATINSAKNRVLTTLSASLGPLNNRAWFFTMVGSQQNQSFHELSQADYGAGALTFVTSSLPLGQPVRVDFVHKQAVPSAGAAGLQTVATNYDGLRTAGFAPRVKTTAYWATFGSARADQRLAYVAGDLTGKGVPALSIDSAKVKVPSGHDKERAVEVALQG